MLVYSFIEYHARSTPDRACLIQDDQILTYRAVCDWSNEVAEWLSEIGVRKGDCVGVLGENSICHFVLFLATMQIGATLAPLNYRLAELELVEILEDASAKLLLVTDETSFRKCEGIPRFQEKYLVLRAEPTWGDRGWPTITNLGDIPPRGKARPPILASEPVLRLYTSGTTGRPKAVILSHYCFEQAMLLNRLGAPFVCLVTAPLFHIGGLGGLTFQLMAGGTVVLHKRFEPEAILQDVTRFGVERVFLVPAMIQALLKQIERSGSKDFSHLKRIAYGSAPISETLLRAAIEVFKCEFVQTYGMTETTGSVTVLTPDDHLRALSGQPDILRSCGKAAIGVELKILDRDGIPLPIGASGEVVVRSPTNMQGYWRRPKETAETLVDGWVRTGDIGYLDSEGFLYLRDRLKEMIVSGGENIYPAEIENVLSSHPSISEVAVIGIPDERFGETPLAICVLRASKSLTEVDLVEFCRNRIAGYKIPRKLVVVEVLPRNAAGKVVKARLREPYWSGKNRNVN